MTAPRPDEEPEDEATRLLASEVGQTNANGYPELGVQPTPAPGDSRSFALGPRAMARATDDAAEPPEPSGSVDDDVEATPRAVSPDDPPPPSVPKVGEPSPNDGGLTLRLGVVTDAGGDVLELNLDRRGELRDDAARKTLASGIEDLRRDLKHVDDEANRVGHELGVVLKVPDPAVHNSAMDLARRAHQPGETGMVLTGLEDLAGQLANDLQTTSKVDATIDSVEEACSGNEAANAVLNLPLVKSTIDEQLTALADSITDVQSGHDAADEVAEVAGQVEKLARLGEKLADTIVADPAYDDVRPHALRQQFAALRESVANPTQFTDVHHESTADSPDSSPSGLFGQAEVFRNPASALGQLTQRGLPEQVTDLIYRAQRPAQSTMTESATGERVDLHLPLLYQPSELMIDQDRDSFHRKNGRFPEGDEQARLELPRVEINRLRLDASDGLDAMLDAAATRTSFIQERLRKNALTADARVAHQIARVQQYVNQLAPETERCRRLPPGAERNGFAKDIVRLAAQTSEIAYQTVVEMGPEAVEKLGGAVKETMLPHRDSGAYEEVNTPTSRANENLLSAYANTVLSQLDAQLALVGEDPDADTALSCRDKLMELTLAIGELHRPDDPRVDDAITDISAVWSELSSTRHPVIFDAAKQVVAGIRASGLLQNAGIDPVDVAVGQFRGDPMVEDEPTSAEIGELSRRIAATNHRATMMTAVEVSQPLAPREVTVRSWVPDGSGFRELEFSLDSDGRPVGDAVEVVKDSVDKLWRASVQRAAAEAGREVNIAAMSEQEVNSVASKLTERPGGFPADDPNFRARRALYRDRWYYNIDDRDIEDLTKLHEHLRGSAVDAAAAEDPRRFLTSTTEQLRQTKVEGLLDGATAVSHAYAIDAAAETVEKRLHEMAGVEREPTELDDLKHDTAQFVELAADAMRAIGDDPRTAAHFLGHSAANELEQLRHAVDEISEPAPQTSDTVSPILGPNSALRKIAEDSVDLTLATSIPFSSGPPEEPQAAVTMAFPTLERTNPDAPITPGVRLFTFDGHGDLSHAVSQTHAEILAFAEDLERHAGTIDKDAPGDTVDWASKDFAAKVLPGVWKVVRELDACRAMEPGPQSAGLAADAVTGLFVARSVAEDVLSQFGIVPPAIQDALREPLVPGGVNLATVRANPEGYETALDNAAGELLFVSSHNLADSGRQQAALDSLTEIRYGLELATGITPSDAYIPMRDADLDSLRSRADELHGRLERQMSTDAGPSRKLPKALGEFALRLKRFNPIRRGERTDVSSQSVPARQQFTRHMRQDPPKAGGSAAGPRSVAQQGWRSGPTSNVGIPLGVRRLVA